MATTKTRSRRRTMAAFAVTMSTLGAVGALATGPAAAAPGDCAPSHRTYHIMAGDTMMGSVGLNISACPNQAPHLWSVDKGEERAGFVGGVLARDVDAFVNRGPGRDTDTERWFNTRILINVCVPGLGDWWESGCFKDAEWSVRYHLVNSGGEVTLRDTIIDPSPDHAGYNQDEYHLTSD